MKYELQAPKLKALPVQLIELGEDVVLKRGRIELKVSGPGAATAVQRLLVLLGGEGRTQQELLEHFAAPDRTAIEALVQHLQSKRILVGDGQAPTAGEPETNLDVFYWHFGTTTDKVRGSLAGKRFLIVGVNPISRQLATTLQREAPGCVDLADVPGLRDVNLFDEDGRLLESQWSSATRPTLHVANSSQIDPDRYDCLIGTSDRGGSAALREWNEICVLHGRNFLPVTLQDLVGYIGPLVVPHETACLERVRLRQDSHLSDPIARRTAEAESGNSRGIHGFHPVMATVLAEMAVFELIRFYGIGWPWWRVGSLIEVNLLASSCMAHKVLRLPRCPVCTTLHER